MTTISMVFWGLMSLIGLFFKGDFRTPRWFAAVTILGVQMYFLYYLVTYT